MLSEVGSIARAGVKVLETLVTSTDITRTATVLNGTKIFRSRPCNLPHIRSAPTKFLTCRSCLLTRCRLIQARTRNCSMVSVAGATWDAWTCLRSHPASLIGTSVTTALFYSTTLALLATLLTLAMVLLIHRMTASARTRVSETPVLVSCPLLLSFTSLTESVIGPLTPSQRIQSHSSTLRLLHRSLLHTQRA